MLVAIQHVCLINKYQEEKFGDTKRLIRSRNSKKYMQYKGKRKNLNTGSILVQYYMLVGLVST
jgi:hypothetical protein